MSDYPFDIRPPIPSDRPFIFNTWFEQAKAQYTFERGRKRSWEPHVAYPRFAEALDHRRRRLLRRAKVLVACPEEFPETIAGYICYENAPPALHMLYVWKPYRGPEKALPRRLLTAAGLWGDEFEYTQHTGAMVRLAPRWNASYNPYLLEMENFK